MRILETATDVTDDVLNAAARCVEDRFAPGIPLDQEDFIDRLCDDYARGWDIERLDTPAVRKIMRHARTVRAEL